MKWMYYILYIYILQINMKKFCNVNLISFLLKISILNTKHAALILFLQLKTSISIARISQASNVNVAAARGEKFQHISQTYSPD